MMWKRFIFLGWCALTLVTLFFYPLIATIHDDLWYLQWRKYDAYDLLGVYVILTILMTTVLFGISTIRQTRLKCIVSFVVALIPFMSFGSQIIRQITGVKGIITHIAQWVATHMAVTSGIALVIFLCFAAWLYMRPRQLLLLGAAVVLILSPMNVLAVWTVGTAKYFSRGTIEKSLVETQRVLPNTYLFLFDELSYEFLYDENGQIGRAFPNIAALSLVSDNYHAAQSPDQGTFHS